MTKFANLALAGFMAVFVLVAVLRTIDGPWSVLGVVLPVVTGVWLVASVGLFYEGRFGWYGSVIGTGTMLACVLVPVCKDILFFLVQRGSVGLGQVVEAMMKGSMGALIVLPISLGLVDMRFKHLHRKHTG